ncbi:MAG TPA: FAD-dependent oxidoreductase [Natronosporangium sp.]|nr:FAD-dependent oxidoreductase [Natronosporangium sp.]
MNADQRTFVIVGAGLAGGRAAQTLREEGFAGRIVLVGEETEPPYERPPLSKGYLLGAEPRQRAFLQDEDWWAGHGIDLRLGCRVTGLDPANHTVTLNGFEDLRYDRLLLATGSRLRTLTVPGHDLHRVRYLRTLDEADLLLADLQNDQVQRVVVIGSGWIGMEVAAAARHHRKDVTVVARGQLPLSMLGPEVGALFRDLHRAHGVHFRFGTEVTRFRGTGEGVSTVVLTDGTELPADLVVVAIGVTPATELAEMAGLAVDDGVLTGADLRTSDPDIYACGDVARIPSSLAGAPIRVEHWARAYDSGPAAARAMLGQPVTFDAVPFFFTDQYDLGMEFSGWLPPGGYRRVVFRGDPTLVDGRVPEYLVFWLDADHRVLAGMNVNIWEVADRIQALIRGRRPVDPQALADPTVPLDQLIH